MESSWYLCAIKVLYTGRATFESRVLTGHRFRGRPKRSALRDAWNYLSSSLLPLSAYVAANAYLVLLLFVIYERWSDRFTYNGCGQGGRRKAHSIEGSVEKRERRDFVATTNPSVLLSNKSRRVTFITDLLLNIPWAFCIAYLNSFLTKL